MSRKVKFLHRPYIPLESNLWLRKHHTNSVLQGIYRQRNNILVSFFWKAATFSCFQPLWLSSKEYTQLGSVGGKTWRHGYEGKDMYNFIEKRINNQKKAQLVWQGTTSGTSRFLNFQSWASLTEPRILDTFRFEWGEGGKWFDKLSFSL